MPRRLNTTLVSGLLGLLIAAVFWFSREDLSRLSIIFPRAVLLIMAVVSLALVIRGLMKPDSSPIFAEGDNRRILVTGATLFAWVLAIPRLGFIVTSVTTFTFLTWYLAVASRPVSLARLGVWLVIVIVEVTGFYLIFTRLLHVPLPRGVFF